MTFNGVDYTPVKDDIVHTFYNIFGSFPQSGPADAFDEVILVKGAGFKQGTQVMCVLNKTEIAPIEISSNLIKCPMALPTKDPTATGNVKFGVSFDHHYNDFGNFAYYDQVSMSDVQPRYGPSEGKGIVYIYGTKFSDNFIGAELGCKIGESIGQGWVVDSTTMKCVVESMDLVNEGEQLAVGVALNSYSWVYSSSDDVGYVPYGVTGVFPSSGPYSGNTQVMITGKGF